jgi:hypothetical protein
LKNSFRGVSPTKFVRKLLIVGSPQAVKFAEITGLVPFSTPTPGYASYRAPTFRVMQKKSRPDIGRLDRQQPR